MIENKKSNKANLENKKSTFFLIGLVLALSLVLYAFEWKTQKAKEVIDLGSTDFVPSDYIFIPSTPAEKKDIPKPVIQIIDFEIVDDEMIVDDVDIFSSEPDDEVDVNFMNYVFEQTENAGDKEEEIRFTAEIMPEFPGGERALLNYLARNVKYPLIAQENGIEGRVFVSFVVDEEGNVFDVSIVRGVDTSLDNEALRVVRGMPKWSPGMQAGKAVKVGYNVPINFDLR